MKLIHCVAVLVVCAGPLFCQWELGAVGGAGFRRSIGVTNPSGSADFSFRPGVAWGFYGGLTEHGYLGGEAHYLYEIGGMRVKSGSGEATMDARAQVVHFDFLVHTASSDRVFRPFFAIGGGVKIYEGLGPDRAEQPLSDFVMLTRTREVKPVMSPAIGLKAKIAPYLLFRAELRYFLSPRPDKVAAPGPQAQMNGWVHDFVPLVGIAATF